MAELRHLIYTIWGTLILMMGMDFFANGYNSGFALVGGYALVSGALFAWADFRAHRRIAKIREKQWQEKMEKRRAARRAEEIQEQKRAGKANNSSRRAA